MHAEMGDFVGKDGAKALGDTAGFEALMAERNVTRAAERNGLSQPAVSKALNRLRFLFDDPLFVRRDRAMEPTSRARELAGPIHGALADISRTLTQPAAF